MNIAGRFVRIVTTITVKSKVGLKTLIRNMSEIKNKKLEENQMAIKISFSNKDVGTAVKKSNQAARDQFKKSVSRSSSDVRKWFGGK